MKKLSRLCLWLVAGSLACFLLFLGMDKLVGHLHWSSGRGESFLVDPILFSLCEYALLWVICFLVFRFCVVRVGYRISELSLVSIAVVALAFVVCLVLLYKSKPPYQYFFDGFMSRVSENIKESDTITWAEQIFADSKLSQTVIKTGNTVVRLPPSRSPAFLSPLFYGATPSAVVTYTEDGTPVCIHLYVGGHIAKWGIAIFTTTSMPNNSDRDRDYRQCGNRIFGFHSNH